MNVLFVVNSVVRQGTYFRWHNLGLGLTRLGHRVTVAAFEHDRRHGGERETTIDGLACRLRPGFRGQSLFSQESHPLAAFRPWRRPRDRFDLVHVFQPFLTSARPLLRGRPAAGPPVAYDWDDLWEDGLLAGRRPTFAERWMQRVTVRLERTLPAAADLVTTCSRVLAHGAHARRARRVAVVPNGYWPGAVPARAEARRRLGLRSDAVYAGFMGRTITAEELRWLVAALEACRRLPASCRLAVCGLPPDVAQSAWGRDAERLDYLGVLPPEQCRDFAAGIDFGLLPLEDAPLNRARFPIKFADYLAAGTPVLTTRVGPCADLAQGWPFVTQVDPRPEAWVAGLVRCFGTNAIVDRETVESRLTWHRAAAALEEAYRLVVPAPAAAPRAGQISQPGEAA